MKISGWTSYFTPLLLYTKQRTPKVKLFTINSGREIVREGDNLYLSAPLISTFAIQDYSRTHFFKICSLSLYTIWMWNDLIYIYILNYYKIYCGWLYMVWAFIFVCQCYVRLWLWLIELFLLCVYCYFVYFLL